MRKSTSATSGRNGGQRNRALAVRRRTDDRPGVRAEVVADRLQKRGMVVGDETANASRGCLDRGAQRNGDGKLEHDVGAAARCRAQQEAPACQLDTLTRDEEVDTVRGVVVGLEAASGVADAAVETPVAGRARPPRACLRVGAHVRERSLDESVGERLGLALDAVRKGGDADVNPMVAERLCGDVDRRREAPAVQDRRVQLDEEPANRRGDLSRVVGELAKTSGASVRCASSSSRKPSAVSCCTTSSWRMSAMSRAPRSCALTSSTRKWSRVRWASCRASCVATSSLFWRDCARAMSRTRVATRTRRNPTATASAPCQPCWPSCASQTRLRRRRGGW